MKLTKELIQNSFSAQTYSRGLDYYKRGCVYNFDMEKFGNVEIASCTVEGRREYDVSLDWDGKYIRGSCNCPQADAVGRCKHMVAALLTFIDYREKATNVDKSNRGGQMLLGVYQGIKDPDLLLDKTKNAQLVPQINYSYDNDYPRFTFRVGFDRLYVVRDVHQFLSYVAKGETADYGKSLKLYHHLDQFDEFSQKLIAILMDEFREFKNFGYHPNRFYYDDHYFSKINEIQLTGSSFDRLFDLLQGRSVERSETKGTVTFQTCDPNITVSLEPQGKQAQVSLHSEPTILHYFGGQKSLYAVSNDKILRCSDIFRQRVYPMFSFSVDSIRLSQADLPTFCNYVLPAIQDIVTLEDKENVLDEYIPEACTPCYYFDMVENTLTATVRFRYGETMVAYGTSPEDTKHIKRNIKVENAAAIPLSRHMHLDEKAGSGYLADAEEIFTFLTDTLSEFHSYGDVYVSQNIKRLQVGRKSVQAGISVSDGMLTLNLDSGEFPPEELESLYLSMIQKKKFHRLKDGRYLELNGSPYEAIAETAHMLQLTPKDLESGTATLPAFRALYLDQVLQDSEGLTVQRDKGFRAMLRAFKSVSDSDYTLPSDLEAMFRPYQKYGFQWLKTLEANGFGGILADEMGLGKTAQTIAWLRTVPRKVVGAPSLVVCPTSLILNWADECAKFAPDLNIQLLIGNAAERKRCIEAGGDYDLWVTSYDLLKRDLDLYKPLDFYGMILDEAQYIKNKSTLASKAVKQINCRQRFVLTGTPIENRLSELWNLFDFLMPGYLFSHNAFVEKLEKPIVKSLNPEAGRRLSLMVQPFLLRRLKQDVLKELPPKVEHIRNIQLSEGERKVYQAFALAAKNSLQEAGQGKLQILAALTRLRQICCDPGLCLENYSGETSKLDACIELCTGLVENGHQVLVFSQFTSMLDRIRERLAAEKIPNFTIQGSTSKEERARLVKDFQAGAASVFLISLKAGGTGLNLTAADCVIHCDPWWNIAAQNQATDRTHRIGQKTSVHVYKLIAKDTIEEKIMELQSRKAELMDVVTSETEENLRSLSTQELLELFD